MMSGSASYFDLRAARYLERSGSGLWRRAREAEWRSIAERLDPAPSHEILDAGCGAGYYSLRLREAGCRRITGIDASRSMIEAYAAQGFDGIHVPIEAFVSERAFDRILLAGVLEFIEDPDAALAALAAALKPDGRIVCLIPDPGWAGRAYRFYHAAQGCPTAVREPRRYFRAAESLGLRPSELARATPISWAFSLRR